MNLRAESFINECSELLCCDHSWGQTNLQGITLMALHTSHVVCDADVG